MQDDDLLRALTAGPATGSELQARLGVSQSALSRAVARLSASVMMVGRARATRYARRQAVPGLTPELPVYRIDPAGLATEIGRLSPIHGGFVFEDMEQGGAEIHPGLPWFLADMRPQGFIGRAHVRRHADLGLPPRLSDWSDLHALVAIARRGEDAPGNLIVGEESFSRWMVTAPSILRADQVPAHYPALAEQALVDDVSGTSAGGEQPKFTAAVAVGDDVRQVLVKFSGPVDTPAGRRWADLLVCEHLALQIIAEAGLPAAQSRLIEARGRMFLEVTRFDRVGARGRLGLISLGTVDDALVGERRDWSGTARALVRLKKLSREDAERIAWLQAFGRCVANTDMHFGNLSLFHHGAPRFELAPAYDMLPMRYAPAADGTVQPPAWMPPNVPPLAVSQWSSALDAARRFWQRVETAKEISPDLRGLAAPAVTALSPAQ